jgi:hypothetical protein
MKTNQKPTPRLVQLGSARSNTKAVVTGVRDESNHILQFSN